MRGGLMYGGYGTAWWAHHAVGLLLPQTLLPTRIPTHQTTSIPEHHSPIHPEPSSPARASSPIRCTPERTKFAGKFFFFSLLVKKIKQSVFARRMVVGD